jgi:hypothetical protein
MIIKTILLSRQKKGREECIIETGMEELLSIRTNLWACQSKRSIKIKQIFQERVSELQGIIFNQ